MCGRSCHLASPTRPVFSSLTCTTTPCPTTSWPLVTWKGSGAHVPLSRDLSPSAQETPAIRVQPNRSVKTKEPSFRYTA
ncbi:unnamed protein product [Spirodela intermedia]|uniref:Uncharacterized protein n=1 Tax=Spirodela intermedia TaxID=51605 RepID=A0A7I8K799_SPIIN|nr:unnamed protein product [Spirodela intermedia]